MATQDSATPANALCLKEYLYIPLKRLDSVRLLVLNPAKTRDAPVCVSLLEVPLDIDLKFAALSYTWSTEDGDGASSQRVECDGAYINITRNCEAALRRVRLDSTYQILWIDAICINQSSDAEKSLQIPMMRRLYSRADRVYIWIGEACEHTDLGMIFIQDFATEIGELHSLGQNMRESKHYQEVVKDMKAFRKQGIDAFTPAVRGVWEIFNRQWWKRLWVIQELALAQDAVLICGDKHKNFGNVERVIDALARNHPGKPVAEHEFLCDFITPTFSQFLMKNFLKRAEANGDNELWKTEPGRKAFSILETTRSCLATDPRDKIYGILGFFGDPGSDPENILPVPDYSKTTAEVYADAAREILANIKDLDILTTCYGKINSMPDLPSWAPSWNTTQLKFFSEKVFSAAKDSCFLYEASGDSRLLKVKGKRVDVIEKVATTLDDLADFTYTNLGYARLWCQWSSFALSLSSYCTGENMSDVLLHTLCWGTNARYDRFKPDEYRETFEAWLSILRSEDSLEKISEDLFQNEVAFTYSKRASSNTLARTMSTTSNSSYLALVPIGTSSGDQVAIFCGAKIPFVLRAEGDNFKILGPCYVHGIMDGEAFPKEPYSEDLESFMLC